MKKLLRHILMTVLLWPLVATADTADIFTEDEQRWMASHPEVTYTFTESWPLEYFKDGQHLGLSREYLTYIEQVSGLTFRPALQNEIPQLHTNMAPGLMPSAQRSFWRYSQRWLTANAVIITALDEHHIRTLDHLKDETVAVVSGTVYEGWISRHYPDITLKTFKDSRQVLESVYSGEVRAAIGSDIVMRPQLYRNYSHHLAIAGLLPEMVSGIHMGVPADALMLLSIINKSLAGMPVGQSDRIFNNWLNDMKLGYPSRAVILSLYSVEIGFFMLIVVVLILSLAYAVARKKKAVEKARRKAQFFSILSHEIRTPLNAMTASLELLRLPCTEERRLSYIQLAQQSSRDLLRLLDDILEHCRISQKKILLKKNCFSLTAFTDSLINAHLHAAQKKGLSLSAVTTSVPENLWIVTDECRLRQILSNLLSNAVKFTEAGRIQLSILPEQENEKLLIVITDTGIGIPDGAMKTLFDAWTQADNISFSRHGGSGLGLYICNELLKLAGGTLNCVSEPGQGTRFTVTLPVTYCVEPERDESEAPLGHRFSNESSILVVEDNPASRKMLAAQLEYLGCHYDVVNDGMSALEKLKDEHYYNAILLDCNLPDIGGYSVASRLRDYERAENRDPTPIVAISAMDDEEHLLQCKNNGIDAVLPKPIIISQLGKILSRWCVPVSVERALPDSDEIIAVLKEDILLLCGAAERKETAEVKYYLHRLKGVAQMYGFDYLAEKISAFESVLRETGQKQGEAFPYEVTALRDQLMSAVHAE